MHWAIKYLFRVENRSSSFTDRRGYGAYVVTQNISSVRGRKQRGIRRERKREMERERNRERERGRKRGESRERERERERVRERETERY